MAARAGLLPRCWLKGRWHEHALRHSLQALAPDCFHCKGKHVTVFALVWPLMTVTDRRKSEPVCDEWVQSHELAALHPAHATKEALFVGSKGDNLDVNCCLPSEHCFPKVCTEEHKGRKPSGERQAADGELASHSKQQHVAAALEFP